MGRLPPSRECQLVHFYILFLNLKLEKVRMKEKKEKKGWEITRIFFSHKEKCVVLVEVLSFECIEFFLYLLRRLPALISSSFAPSPLSSYQQSHPCSFCESSTYMPPILSFFLPLSLFFQSINFTSPLSPSLPLLPLSHTKESKHERGTKWPSVICASFKALYQQTPEKNGTKEE